jgi:hypothetical protein
MTSRRVFWGRERVSIEGGEERRERGQNLSNERVEVPE